MKAMYCRMLGTLLTLIALAIREILWLRVILTTSQAFLFSFHLIYSENMSSVFWTAVFMIVNLYMIVWIVVERRPRLVPVELADLREKVFDHLTTREFLYFLNMGKAQKITDEYLVKFGEKNKQLMILDGMARVEINNKRISTLKRGSFIAEISFLTGEPTSADVRADGELTIISWDSARLKKVMHNNSAFWVKLQHAISKDLVKKIFDAQDYPESSPE